MNNGKSQFVLLFFLIASVFVAYAEDGVKYESRTIEFSLPDTLKVKDTTHNKSVYDQSNNSQLQLGEQSSTDSSSNKQIVDPEQVNILKRISPVITPEMVALGKQIDELLKQPVNIKTVKDFKSQIPLFIRYVEREFKVHDDVSRHIQLISLTALLVGPESTSKILQWCDRFRKHPHRLRTVIHALGHWPSTNETEAFINSLLEAEVQSPDVIRAALLYQAWNSNQSARQYTGIYSVPKTGTNYQYLSLYLAGVLGDKSYVPFIVEALDAKPPVYQQYYLLLALSKLLIQSEYSQIARSSNISPVVKDSIQRQIEFSQLVTSQVSSSVNDTQQQNVKKETRIDLEIENMLDSVYEEEKLLAIAYLIQQKSYEKLLNLITERGVLGVEIYHRAVFAGLDLDKLGVSVELELTSDKALKMPDEIVNNWKMFIWLLLLVVSMILGVRMLLKHLHRKDVSI